MLKDVVVNLATDGASDPAADFALSIAEAFEAHVTAVAFVLQPIVAMGSIASDIIDGAVAADERAANAACELFGNAARRRMLSNESQIMTAPLVDAAERFGIIARSFDLSVVAQTDPEKPGAGDLFVESALFASGRPILVVPYIQNTPLKLDRVVCCWDGSRAAARAIADATPFLHNAKNIDVLVVATNKVRSDEIAGADMTQHLARHGFKVNLKQIAAADIGVANAILSYAADTSADLLVMGGYGHSRWREFILGGATRDILSMMTIPTLMSH